MILDAANQTLTLDGSSLGCWDQCPQQYWFHHVAGGRGYVPDGDAAFYTAGGALHDALKIRRCECNTAPVPSECLARMEAAIRARFAATDTPPNWRTPEEVTRLLWAYLDKYPEESFTALECEQPFELELGRIILDGAEWVIRWAGKRDAVVSYTPGQAWVMDTKTASRKDWPPKKYGQSRAMFGYCWAWREQSGQMPEGFIMDLCYWKEPTQKTPQPAFEFDRPAFPVRDWQLTEWKAGVLLDAAQIIRCHNTDAWPKSGASGHPNPCLGCAYFEPCGVVPTFRLGTLQAMPFKPNTWVPTSES